jgi:hypothetical protein
MKRQYPIHTISPVLGKEAGVFAFHLDHLLPELDGTEYEFEPSEVFQARPFHEMNRVYWTEILYRSHWAAASAMVRLHRWLSGFNSAHGQTNLLAAAACARGMIEAAADADYSLHMVPPTLTRDHVHLKAALEGNLLPPWINPELEERLIHVSHARKPQRGEKLPSSHKAQYVAQYRERLDEVQPKLSECYGMLCDLTHPGASSVLSFAESMTPDASVVRFSPDAEVTELGQLTSMIREVVADVLMLGLNPTLVTLKVLNDFPVQRLHTTAMNEVDLTDIPMWTKARALLDQASPPLTFNH